MNNNLKKFLLIFGDLGIMYVSLLVTLMIRYDWKPSGYDWGMHFGPFSTIFIFWLIIFYISDLYNLHAAVNNSRFGKMIARSFAAASLVSVLFFYLSPSTEITPKVNLAIFIGVFALLFVFWRRLYNWSLASYLPKNTIAIIGRNRLVEELLTELKNKPHLGFNISFIMDEKSTDREIAGTPIFSNIKELPTLIEKRKVNNIMLASAPDSEILRGLLFECLPLKISFISLISFYETITGKVPIEAISKMWFLENLNEGNKSGFDTIKRVADLILALFILLVTLVFWPIVAILIKLESRGPVLFKQTRTGANGENFEILKFRTMKIENNDQSPITDGDTRITKLGLFLRKTRLDEIPQVLNIIKGDMSFVGPRPERPELITELEKQVPFYRERMLVKPGVTGMDQVAGEYHSPSYEDTMKKLQYDLYYVKNRSIYLDVAILLKTVRTVMSQGGK
jgi:exopolysaccharide biosynthesis polyprenyl glycosylphosphotransferase